MTRARLALGLVAAALALPACGGDGDGDGGSARVTTVQTTRVEVVRGLGGGGGFDPVEVYKREAPGVVTVISVFEEGGLGGLLDEREDGARGLGSGFVLNGRGEVATNAHVVTAGEGGSLKQAKEVFVEFGDGNKVAARVVGFDPNADVALLRIDPAGLDLRPLPLGTSRGLVVGAPVAAIGSPFGEPQSLSVGVVSAVDRDIESLTSFQISGAIQTDAAINHGNSGGPLVNAKGEVIGINSQIRSTGGGGEGVGFAVPVDTVKRSLADLREHGKVRYAYLGVSTVGLYPQLVERFDLPVREGAWVQEVTPDSPAADAGLRGGRERARFQAVEYFTGGDVITRVGARPIADSTQLGAAIAARRPGETIPLEIRRQGRRRTLRVKLAERPLARPARRGR